MGLNVPEIDVQGILLERLYEQLIEIGQTLKQLPTPNVSVEPQDLSAVVNAVTSLRPSATAEEIGQAVARALGPQDPGTAQAETLQRMADVMEQVEYRLRAPSTIAGSGTMNLPTNLQENNRLKVSTQESGVWSYAAGTSGTESVPFGAKVIGIVAHATTAGSFTVNGGDSIPVPANVGIELEPKAQLVGPFDIVFTGTDTYVVEMLS